MKRQLYCGSVDMTHHYSPSYTGTKVNAIIRSVQITQTDCCGDRQYFILHVMWRADLHQNGALRGSDGCSTYLKSS